MCNEKEYPVVSKRAKQWYNLMRNFFLFLLLLALSTAALSQTTAKKHELSSSKLLAKDSVPPAYLIGVEMQASILPKGIISTIEGNYHLQSRIQSSFSLGLNYEVILDNSFNMTYGLQVNLTNSNYYLHIADNQLPGFLRTKGAPQIEDKQNYFKVAFPVLISYHFPYSKTSDYAIKAGLKLNYSGFSGDERVTTQLADTNYQFYTIFNGAFTSNNNQKPWVTYIGAIAKSLHLKNGAVLSIQLLAELGRTRFIQGNYQIIVPNQLPTTGAYSVPGSSFGIGVQYAIARSRKKHRSL
jgi:hypothetical protein